MTASAKHVWEASPGTAEWDQEGAGRAGCGKISLGSELHRLGCLWILAFYSEVTSEVVGKSWSRSPCMIATVCHLGPIYGRRDSATGIGCKAQADAGSNSRVGRGPPRGVTWDGTVGLCKVPQPTEGMAIRREWARCFASCGIVGGTELKRLPLVEPKCLSSLSTTSCILDWQMPN